MEGRERVTRKRHLLMCRSINQGVFPLAVAQTLSQLSASLKVNMQYFFHLRNNDITPSKLFGNQLCCLLLSNIFVPLEKSAGVMSWVSSAYWIYAAEILLTLRLCLYFQ